jgi:hypothetical protein
MSDMLQRLLQKSICVGRSQYHLAVAGGCEVYTFPSRDHFIVVKRFAPTRYREVVLTATHYDLFCKRLFSLSMTRAGFNLHRS